MAYRLYNNMLRHIRGIVCFLVLLGIGQAAQSQVFSRPPILVNPLCQGDSTGSITFQLDQDSSLYFFDWSGGNAQTGLSIGLYRQRGLIAATYNVFVLDLVSNRSQTFNLTLSQPARILVAAGSDIRSCVGQSIALNGTSNATGTFTWSYTDGAANPTTLNGSSVIIPGTGAGSLAGNTTTLVKLTVTTAAGCKGRDSVQIVTNPAPTVSFSFSNPNICVGQQSTVSFTGSASSDAIYTWILPGSGAVFTENNATAISGIGPHPILFSQAGLGSPPLRSVILRVTEPTSSGIGACQTTASAALRVNALPVVTLTGLPARTCINAGSITPTLAPAGGVLRGPGVSGSTFNPAVAGVGTHTLTYTYTNGSNCTDSAKATITVLPKPSASITGLAAQYCATAASVPLTLSPSGGMLTGNGIFGTTFFPDSAAIGPNQIRYIFTDTASCSDTAQASVTILASPTLVALPDSQAICSGATAIVAWIPNPSSASVIYSAATSGSVAGASGGTGTVITQTLSGIGKAIYTAIATSSGCPSLPGKAVVLINGKPIGSAANASICSNTLASIPLQSTLANTTFTWSVAAASTSVSGQALGSGDTISQTLTNAALADGYVRYLVTPTSGGCQGDTFSVYATVKPLPQIAITFADTVICSGDSVSVNLSSTLTQNFIWSAAASNPLLTGYASGVGSSLRQLVSNADTVSGFVNYTIAGLTNGCTGNSLLIRATINPRPTLQPLADTLQVCSGSPLVVALEGTPSGALYTYTQTVVSGTLSGLTNGSGHIIAATPAGNGLARYLISTAAGACSGPTDSFFVAVRPNPVLSAAIAQDTICSKAAAVLVLSTTMPVDSIGYTPISTPGITGAFSGYGDTIRQTLINTSTSTLNQPYKIFSIGGDCPADTLITSVTVLPQLIATADVPIIDICSGDSITVHFSANLAGATYTYFITSSTGLTLPPSGSGSSVVIKGTSTDTVQASGLLQIVAHNGCNSDTLSIPINVRPRPTLIASTPAPVCAGGTVQITFSPTPASSIVTYSLASAGLVTGLSAGNGATPSFVVGGQGLAQLSALATLAGCVSTPVLVDVNVLPAAAKPVISPPGTTSICSGHGISLSTTSTDSLQWYKNGSALPLPLGKQTTIAISDSGLYTLQAFSPLGCGSAFDSVRIKLLPRPATPLVSGDTAFCVGLTATLFTSASGNISWLQNGALLTGQTNDTLLVSAAGAYQSIATNGSACSDTSAPFAVHLRPSPVAPPINGDTALCAGGRGILADASPIGAGWLFNNAPLGVATDTITITQTGTYARIVIDAIGCSDTSAPFVVKAGSPLFTATPAVTQPTCAQSGSIELTLTGDTAKLVYAWTGPGVTPSTKNQSNLQAGTYTVTITDSVSLCSTTLGPLQIIPVDTLKPTATITQPGICGTTAAGISISITGGSGRFGFAWGGGLPPQSAQSNLATGYYTVTILDSVTQCAKTLDSLQILPADTIAPTLTLRPPSTCTAADGKAIVTYGNVAAAVYFRNLATYTIISNLDSAVNLQGGDYAAIVSYGTCQDSLPFSLSAPANFNITVATTPAGSCAQPNSGTARATFAANGSPLLIKWQTAGGLLVSQGTVDTISGLATGSYVVVVRQGLCQDSATFSIAAPPPLVLSVTPTKANCGRSDGSATTSITGGLAPTIVWYNNLGDSLATGATIAALPAGAYLAVATEGLCKDSVPFTISDTLRLTPTTQGGLACSGTSGFATVVSPSVIDSTLWLDAGNAVVSRADTLFGSPGTYRAVVFSNICVDTVAATIPLPNQPTLSVTATDATTCTSSDGSVMATYTAPGVATFTWYKGALLVGNTATVSGLAYGTYKVVAVSSLCVDSAFATVGRPANCGANCGIRLIVSSNPVTCQGGQNGEVVALVSTGAMAGQYAYQVNGAGPWLPSDSVFARFSNLPAGQYGIAVRDVLDTTCTATASQNIGTRVTLSIVQEVDNGSCGSIAGNLRIRVGGGVQPYQLSIDSGRTTLGSFSGDTLLHGLAGGIYHVVVIDGTPCKVFGSAVTISPRQSIHPALITRPVACAGLTNGGFSIDTVTGGSGAYTFRYNGNRTPQSIVLDSLYLGLGVGNNTVFITDAISGCTFDTTFTLTSAPALTVAASQSSPPTCGQPNGSVRISSFAGGSGSGYQVSIVNAVGQIISPQQPIGDSLIRNLPEGNYILRIRDTAGCTDSIPVSLQTIPQEVRATVTPGNVQLCAGQRALFTVSTTFAVPQPVYQWYRNGAPIPSATDDTLISTTLQPGDSVYVQISSAISTPCLTGLPATSNAALILAPPTLPPSVRITPDSATVCAGASASFTAINVNHLLNVRYQFYVNDTLKQTGADSTLTLLAPTNGTRIYAVLLADTAAHCLSATSDTSSTAIVRTINNLAATVSIATPDTATCAGSGIVLTGTTNLASLPGVVYQWLRNNTAISGATGSVYAAIDTAGTYSYRLVVNINPAQGCVSGLPDTSNALRVLFRTVTDPLCRSCALRLRVDSSKNATCANGSNGSIHLSARNGTGQYEYAILAPTTAYQTPGTFNGLAPGVYSFIARDTLNRTCADTIQSVAIGYNFNLQAGVTLVRPSACSGTANGQIVINPITGGLGPFHYKVRSADTLIAANTFANLATGNYQITLVDDSTGCQFFTTATLDSNPPLQAFGHIASQVSCHGSATGSYIVDSVANGQGAYAYSLIGPDSGFTPLLPRNTVIASLRAGSHTIYIKDGSSCEASITFTITEPDSLQLTVSAQQASVCYAGTGKAKIIAFAGGTRPLTLTLLPPGGARPDTIAFPVADSLLTGLVGGDYILNVSDSYGCRKSAAFRVVSDGPQPREILVAGACPGSSNGRITLAGMHGGTRPYTFQLLQDGNLLRTQQDTVFPQLAPGTYSITVTDSSLPMCRTFYTRLVPVLDTLKASVLSLSPSTCAGPDGGAHLLLQDGQAPYQISYDSVVGVFSSYVSVTGDSIWLRNLSARAEGVPYQIKLKDSAPDGGCAATFSFILPGNTPLSYTQTGVDVKCHGDATGGILLTNLRGTGPALIEVSDAQTGAIVKTDSIRDPYFHGASYQMTGIAAGAYNVRIDQYGQCSASQTSPLTIHQPAQIVAHYRNTYPSAPEFADGEIELDSITGGMLPYQIKIGDAEFQAYAPGIYLPKLLPGTLPLLVVDSNQCRVAINLIVTKDTVFAASNVFTPNYDNQNDTWVIKNLQPGTKVEVRNRWGGVVYSSDNYDNKWNGDGLPPATYLYDITPPTGPNIRGWVELIRD